jgi:glyoxylase-like metal-dependent hydrolase (beta-lactamase superfamily II)
MTHDFIDNIRRVNKNPIDHLLLTHHHGDHVYGASFSGRPEIVSHARCREVMWTMATRT